MIFRNLFYATKKRNINTIFLLVFSDFIKKSLKKTVHIKTMFLLESLTYPSYVTQEVPLGESEVLLIL